MHLTCCKFSWEVVAGTCINVASQPTRIENASHTLGRNSPMGIGYLLYIHAAYKYM